MDPVFTALVAERARYLAFVQRRVGDRSTAEDILQASFARAMQTASELRSQDRAGAWFYRILRNAIVDHHRQRTAAQSALEKLARESPWVQEQRRVCACAFKVLPMLREEYQSMIRAVDVEGRTVNEVASALGITANNASVRLHRARGLLREKLLEFCVGCCTGKTIDARHDCYCH